MAAFLHVLLSVSLFYTFIAPGACNEYLRFCATVHVSPNIDVTLSNNLVWGKWVKDASNMEEVGGPVPRTNPFTFCAAGRQMSPSGTQGSVTLIPSGSGYSPNANNKFTIEWNYPWFGQSYVKEIYDENIYTVEKIRPGPALRRYNLTYKPPSK